MLERVAIYYKDNNRKTSDAVDRLVDEFHKREVKTCIYRKLPGAEVPSVWELSTKPDCLSHMGEEPGLILSVGGDGTFLETVLRVKDKGIPIAGVNTGRMGFLANISVGEIARSVEMLYKGEYEIIERGLLKLEEPAALFPGNYSVALNEISIQKADPSMITISVYVDDIHLNTYWADGLIISTATGSTAYNLSVGGPILSPGDESIIISPLAPHNLTIRPIVLSGVKKIKMVIEGRSREYIATCDFRSVRLPFSREIHIIPAEEKIKTVMLNGIDFYSTLRNKLMWGADTRN